MRSVPLIRRSPLLFLARCQASYGRVTAFPLPGPPILFITEPDDVRRFLQTNHPSYDKRTLQYDALRVVTGEGLVTSDGSAWRSMRRLVQPGFHRALVNGAESIALRAADAVSSRWDHDGATHDLSQEMATLSLEVATATLLGVDADENARQLLHAVTTALDLAVRRARNPLSPPARLPTPANLELRSALRRATAAVDALVVQRERAGVSPSSPDVLGLLLTARDTGVITHQQVRNEVLTIIVAGHDTLAATLTWTWLLLSESSDSVNALRDEAASSSDRSVARSVIDEALRLFPPVWLVSRRCIREDRFGEVTVPVGAQVFFTPYLMHRDERWWPRPEVFDPTRFRDGALDRTAYLPFGAGPRLCVGRDLALLQAPAIVSSLVRRHDVETPPLATFTTSAAATLWPDAPVVARISRQGREVDHKGPRQRPFFDRPDGATERFRAP